MCTHQKWTSELKSDGQPVVYCHECDLSWVEGINLGFYSKAISDEYSAEVEAKKELEKKKKAEQDPDGYVDIGRQRWTSDS